jgi:RNA polymerase sigma factor (sigma-70 family)
MRGGVEPATINGMPRGASFGSWSRASNVPAPSMDRSSRLAAQRFGSRDAVGGRAPGGAGELTGYVVAARAGDDEAWSRLVARFDGRLRSITRFYRLAAADVDDVVQTTWLRGFERIGQLREPTSIGAWLERIARRECLRLLQRTMSECPTEAARLGDRADEPGPEERLLAIERREVFDRALRRLPERQRRLLALLRVDPTPSYRQISALLDMPIGSIGPIRARSVARVRRQYELWAS